VGFGPLFFLTVCKTREPWFALSRFVTPFVAQRAHGHTPEFAVRTQRSCTVTTRDMETRRARWARVALLASVAVAAPRTPRARVARPTPLAARSLTIDGGAREADRDAVETENRERLSVSGVKNASSPGPRPARRARARRCRRAP